MANPINLSSERILAHWDDYIRVNGNTPKNLFHLFSQAIRIEILTYMNVRESINSKNPHHLIARANLQHLAPDVREVIKAVDRVQVHKINTSVWTFFSDSLDGMEFNELKNFIHRNGAMVSSLKINDAVVGTSSDLVPKQIVTAADILGLVGRCVNLSRLELSNGYEKNLENPISPEDMSQFVTIPFHNLQSLRLDVLSLDIPRLVAGAYLQNLSVLTLSGCSLENNEFQFLVNSRMVKHLSYLNVSGADLTDDVSTLFQTPLHILQELNLNDNDISDLTGFPALKTNHILPSLVALRVIATNVTQEHVDSIEFPEIRVFI